MTLFIPNNIQNVHLHYLQSPQLFGKQDLRGVSCKGLLLWRQTDKQTKSQGRAPVFQLRGREPLLCSIWSTLTGLFSPRRMYKLSATALHTCHSKSDNFSKASCRNSPPVEAEQRICGRLAGCSGSKGLRLHNQSVIKHMGKCVRDADKGGRMRYEMRAIKRGGAGLEGGTAGKRS